MSLCFIILFLLFVILVVPALASQEADDIEEPTITTNKVLVRSDQVYHFQDIDTLVTNPDADAQFHSNNNESFVDGIREGTLRMWYSYGWAGPTVFSTLEEVQQAAASGQLTLQTTPMFTIASIFGQPIIPPDPGPPQVAGAGTGVSPRTQAPMFGYFPLVKTNVSDIEADLLAWQGRFHFDATQGSSSPDIRSGSDLDSGFYFDMMANEVAPSFYISDFKEEQSIRDVYNQLKDVSGDGPAVVADTLLYLNNVTLADTSPDAPGDWDTVAIIHAYHWLTEPGLLTDDGEEMGPSLLYVINACGGNVQTIVTEYEARLWPIPPEIQNRYNTYRETQEEREQLIEGGWTKELLHLSYPGFLTAIQIRERYDMEGWDWSEAPSDIQADYDATAGEPTLSVEKMLWFAAWHKYDRADPIQETPLFIADYEDNGYNLLEAVYPDYERYSLYSLSYIGGDLGDSAIPRYGEDDRGPRHSATAMTSDNRGGRSPWFSQPKTGHFGITRGGEAAHLEQMVFERRLSPEDFDLWFAGPYGEGWRFADSYHLNEEHRSRRSAQGRPTGWFYGHAASALFTSIDSRARQKTFEERIEEGRWQGSRHGREWIQIVNHEIKKLYQKAQDLATEGALDFWAQGGGDLGSTLFGRIILDITKETFPEIPAWDLDIGDFYEWANSMSQSDENRHQCVNIVLGAHNKDIKIKGWKRSLVTIKPWPGTNFEEMINNKIKPALNKREVFIPGILDVQLEVSGPKRYYDYAFQLPTVDKQVGVKSVYNGYFAAEFEQQVNKLPMILEPVIPNLYIVDFANTSVPEYYELLSLNAGLDAGPYISGFNANYGLETPAYESLFEPFGYTSEYRYTGLWVAGVQRGMDDVKPDWQQGRIEIISKKYKNLVFSKMYKQNYLNTTNEARSNPDWVPMYNQIDFSIDIRAPRSGFADTPGLIFHAGAFGNPNLRSDHLPYDPMTHFINDVGMSVHSSRLLAEAYTTQQLPAEKTRQDNDGVGASRENANIISEQLEKSENFKYQNHKVWDLHEWFELYSIPKPPSVNCLRNFHDSRAFPEQALMLLGPAPATSAPAGFVASVSRVKPVPVGAKPRTIDLNEFLPNCLQTPLPFTGEAGGDGGEVEIAAELASYTNPPAILSTPDRTEWRKTGDEAPTLVPIIKKALEDLYADLSTKISQNFRTYRQVLDGQLAYSEPLFYRLNKIDPIDGKVIQSFFFPSDLLRDGFTYIDAQVHYGAQYQYVLYGYYFVVGNEYWYEDLSSPFALEQRQRQFVSGNDRVAELASQSKVSEDVYLVRSWNLAADDAIPDPDGFREQTAGLLGLSFSRYEELVNQARNHVGPAYDNMREVFGEKYYKKPFQNDHHAQFAVNNRPHMVLVQTKVFTPEAAPLVTKIVDSPPLPPGVDIVPYSSVNNRVLLMLNGSVGSYRDNPIIIDQQDIDNYKDQISNQDPSILPEAIEDSNIEKDFEISFSTDDFPEFFEIYRLDTAPTSYRDFSTATRRRLSNTERGKVVMTANSIIDAVTPNKKYWYTFRTIDVHGNVSNPSEVLQFEMVDTGNSIYPLIETYTFPKQEVTYTKPMRKYLKIAPSQIQESKHKNATNAQSFVDNHTLGTRTVQNIWGERYKLRITSKLTGKKVDVNFIFKQASPENKL